MYTKYMNPIALTLSIRSICAEFALRLYVPIVITASAVIFVLVIACGYLVTAVSAWWWLLFAPFILLIGIFIMTTIICRIIIGVLQPAQNHEQKKLVKQFVDTLQETSEMAQTPKFIVFFRLVKDIVRPNQQNLIGEFTSKAGSLKTMLKAIVASFN